MSLSRTGLAFGPGATLRAAAAAAALAVCGALLMSVPPTGPFAVPLAAACLWPWPPAAQAWLERIGLRRRVLVVFGAALATVAAAVSLITGSQLDGHLIHGDFQTYWLGAMVGARYGWSRIFDIGLQQTTWPAAAGAGVPFLPFLNTPPMAWLVSPLLALPYLAAYVVWVALMIACAVLTLALLMPRRWLAPAALIAAGLWVTPYTLASGQNAVIGALAVALTWRLLRAGREGWAGAALALITLRPTATLLLPLAILAAGYRRTFLTWLAVSLVVAGVSVWSLGAHGIADFVQLAADIRRSHPLAVQMTILGWLGQNPAAIGLEIVLAAGALAVAWRGARVPEAAIAAGVLGSLFVTPYIHHQDYVTVMAAGAAVAVTTTRRSFGLVLVALLAAAPPGWVFGSEWEGALLAVEVGWLGWLAFGSRAGSPGWTRVSEKNRLPIQAEVVETAVERDPF